MPCACRVPIDKYPENAAWGPLFWKILHGLAEYSGVQSNALLQSDERRIWIQLLTKLQYCIPCDICRAHYAEWLKEHSIERLETMAYAELGPWIRHWLWFLHNTINEGNDRPLFQESALSVTYKGINITNTWKALEPVMRLAIILNGISLLPWKNWLSTIRTLQGVYGI